MDSYKQKTTRKEIEGRRCSVVLQRLESVDDLLGSKMLNLSDSESDMISCGTASPRGASRANSPGLWAKRRRSDDEMEDDNAPSPKISVSRRGRGRPPTTGQYVGLAKAKAEYNEALREQQRLDAEEELEAELRRKRKAATAFLKTPRRDESPAGQVEGRDIAELGRLMVDSMEMVATIASKSRNLKGTSVRGLKEAAHVGRAVFQELRERTMPEETKLLVEANNRLTAELKELRRKVDVLSSSSAQRVQAVAPAPAPTPAPAQALGMEDMMRAVMVQVGTMLNARLSSFEERLLPEKRVRPTLAADKKRETAALALPSSIEVMETEMSAPTPAPRSSAPKSAPKRGKGAPASAKPVEAKAQPPAEEPWTEVVKRSSRRSNVPKRTKPEKPAQKATRPARSQVAKPIQQARPTVPKAPKLRPPRTAAVVITLQPGATEKGLTYAKVVAEAKARIDLSTLGIGANARMRTTATGAKIIEVPGAEKVVQADSLASKLREVFQGMEEEVKISRPVTTADLRVSGLDESVDITELVEALAKAGGCPASDVRTGLIRRGPAGMGTAFVRCPVTAARQIVASGRLLVGWMSAQVRLLEPRPRRCYRCLAMGHIRAQCRSEVDRSDECYRCGQKGHKANGCSAAPHCTLCAAAGKPADHLSGGKACAKPPSKQARRKPSGTEVEAKSQQTRSSTEPEVTCMEES